MVTFALGVVTLALMGLAIGGIMLLTGNESWGLGDLLAGALYLFSGAIFPARRVALLFAHRPGLASDILAGVDQACPDAGRSYLIDIRSLD